MPTILVTGGCGFIGSHTSLVLLEKGYDICIIDSNINSDFKVIKRIEKLLDHSRNNGKIEMIKGDVRSEKTLEKIFSYYEETKKNICAVIHFAGLKSIEKSNHLPLQYWDVNVKGTLQLLKIMEKYSCFTIVFSSSATVYGVSNKSPIKEDGLIKPINTYGKTKAVIEQILQDLQNNSSRKWKILNLRYFNPIGAHPTGKLGEYDKGLTKNIFPIINKVASKELPFLRVFGKNWKTKDGTGVRDYIHVMDLAEGHVAALEYLFNSNFNNLQNINLGTGKGTTVLEIIEIFEKVNKVEIPFVFEKRRVGDVAEYIADTSLSKIILNWEPKRSLVEMCKDGWNWKLNNINS